MVDQETHQPWRPLVGASLELPGMSITASTPREAVDLARKLIGKAVVMLWQAAPQPTGTPIADSSLLLPASPDLKARLRREAADYGMSVTDWALVKLGFETAQLAAAMPSGRPPVVERWRTRC